MFDYEKVSIDRLPDPNEGWRVVPGITWVSMNGVRWVLLEREVPNRPEDRWPDR